jgi:hypothetical protein
MSMYQITAGDLMDTPFGHLVPMLKPAVSAFFILSVVAWHQYACYRRIKTVNKL